MSSLSMDMKEKLGKYIEENYSEAGKSEKRILFPAIRKLFSRKKNNIPVETIKQDSEQFKESDDVLEEDVFWPEEMEEMVLPEKPDFREELRETELFVWPELPVEPELSAQPGIPTSLEVPTSPEVPAWSELQIRPEVPTSQDALIQDESKLKPWIPEQWKTKRPAPESQSMQAQPWLPTESWAPEPQLTQAQPRIKAKPCPSAPKPTTAESSALTKPQEQSEYYSDLSYQTAAKPYADHLQQPAPALAPKASKVPAAPKMSGIDNFLNTSYEENGVAKMLNLYMFEKDITTAMIYRRCFVDRRLISKIASGKGYHPSKNTILALCIGLQLTLPEGEEFMDLAGYSFSNASKYDLIIKFVLDNRIYDLDVINEMLFEYNQPCIGA